MIHRRRFKRLLHSVFTKLLVIILAAGIAITVTVLVAFSHIRFHGLSHLDRNLLLYTEYIINDLGDPPDFDRAAEIARRTGITIRFDHAERAWQTGKVSAIGAPGSRLDAQARQQYLDRPPQGLFFHPPASRRR